MFQCALADGAEFGEVVRPHPAILEAAVDSLLVIACALVDAHLHLILLRGRSGYGRAFFDHVFPLAVEIDECRQVGFPRLDVVRVKRDLFAFKRVFVA